MKVGITYPVMEPGWTGAILKQWAEAIDQGPFSSLSFGERIAYDNPDFMTAMGACAGWTKRVDLAATVLVAPLYHPVVLAKQLATLDEVSGGRLVAGLGIGGREDDYLAAGADLAGRSNAALAKQVAVMRRVWAGENVSGTLLPTGPTPKPGRPRLMAGAMGPKAVKAASAWADGITGFSFGPDPKEIEQSIRMIRDTWKQAGRPEPKISIGFWMALGPGSRDKMIPHLTRYMNWMDPATVDGIARTAGFTGTDAEFRTLLRQIKDAGADEALPAAISWDLDQVRRVADLVA